MSSVLSLDHTALHHLSELAASSELDMPHLVPVSENLLRAHIFF